MALVQLTGTKNPQKTTCEIETAEVTRVHAINNGLTVHKSNGHSVGIKLANGTDTFKTLTDLMTAICRHEGPDKVKNLPVVMEEHAYLHGDNGKVGLNKSKISATGFDFVR